MSAPGLTVLYRGQLSSCNYGCAYCPFAKHVETRAEIQADKAGLRRFVAWCATGAFTPLSVFFTPWGEALTRSWYRDALVQISNLSHVQKVAIQTNLSSPVGWLRDAFAPRVGVWATFHPSETTLLAFVRQVERVSAYGASVSVGVVGLPENHDVAQQLRAALPGVYVWVNAVKRNPEAMRLDWSAVDPLFGVNATAWASRGEVCDTGERVISVDGEGVARRCHFVSEPIGNLYDGTLRLQARPCPNDTCGCHIGYVHMPKLGLRRVYGEGVLERVPAAVVPGVVSSRA